MTVIDRLDNRVDRNRLYVTGLSSGGSGVWHLALRYGSRIAAIAPVSGSCQWPVGTWPRGQQRPEPAVLEQLQTLPVRAYQIDIDKRAGHPKRDMEWLAWCFGLEEKEDKRCFECPGMEPDLPKVSVNVRCWSSPSVLVDSIEKSDPIDQAAISKVDTRGSAELELWQAEGPLHDWAMWGGRGDNHCFWQRVFPFEEYGLIEWFLRHRRQDDA